MLTIETKQNSYTLAIDKVEQLRKPFDIIFDKAIELAKETDEVMVKEDSKEKSELAHVVHRKCVKARTALTRAHKEAKKEPLAVCKYLDSLKNNYLLAMQGNEEKLKKVETYYERIEAKRIDSLRIEREKELTSYDCDISLFKNLGELKNDEWHLYLDTVVKKHHEQIEAAVIEAEKNATLQA